MSLAAGAVYRHVLPGLIANRVERMLAARGFPDAHVGHASLALDRVELTGVTLGDGLAPGAIELDAGLSLLWRPRLHQLTIRDATVSASALDQLSRAGPSAAGDGAPVELVRLVDVVLLLGGSRIAVSGMIAPGPTWSVDLTATSEQLIFGPLELREPRATLHDSGPGLRVCLAGRIADAAVEACATLPHTLAELRAMRTLAAAGTASAATWKLRGTGTLSWTSALALADGHLDLIAPMLTLAHATVEGVRVTADLAGALASPALDARGVVVVDRLAAHDATASASARELSAPFVGRLALAGGALQLTPSRPVAVTARDASIRLAHTAVDLVQPSLVALEAHRPISIGEALPAPHVVRWSAGAARIGNARFRAASGTLVAGRTLAWRAAEAEWAGVRFREPSGTLVAGQSLAWRGAEAEWAGVRFREPAGSVELDGARRYTARWAAVHGRDPIELGAGELRGHRAEGQWIIDHARARTLGGELMLDPVTVAANRPVDLIVHARGVELHRLLASFAHGRADGNGALDGELALRIDDAGVQLTRAALHARGRGSLQLSDPAWRAQISASATGFALHQRIAATLADLEYARLAAVLHPIGADPELQVTLQGRGRRVAQELDLTINLRGLREVAHRLPFAHLLRSPP